MSIAYPKIKLKHCATLNMGQSPSSEDINRDQMGLPFIQGCAEFGEKYPSPINFCESPRKTAKAGDILISVRAPVGEMNFACTNVGIGRGICAVSERIRVSDRGYLFHSIEASKQVLLSVSTGSTYDAVSTDDLGALEIYFPPLPIQRAIASFLDKETSRIDALISKKERQIELLQEKRQAIITRAVTKGLDPSAKMKDSGLEWIGEIPSKWEIVSIKRVLRKADYGISDNLYGEGDIPVLRMGNISNGVIDLTDLRFIDNVDKSLYLTPGDLLYNRTNSLAMIAKVGLFVGSDKYDKISFASYLVRLRPNNRTTSKFLSYLLNVSGVIDEARAIAYPSINQVNLSPTRYLTIKIPLPPLTEQETIVDQLIRVDHQTNQMSDLIRKSLALLQEYRSSLITAAVSGQIDVSKMRAKAPE